MKGEKNKTVVKEVPGTVVQKGVFAEEKAPIRCDYILHREINYVGSRSQKPSSWRTSVVRLLFAAMKT